MIVIVVIECVLGGNDQVEPDSKMTGDVSLAWLSVGDGLFGTINAVFLIWSSLLMRDF